MRRYTYKHCELVAEGKTKRVYTVFGSATDDVFIVSKDDITAGDGVKREVLDGKAILSTETTCNCFKLLEREGVRTHFIEHMDERGFRARRVNMFPIELVARRIATGSYLKRCPGVAEGTRFENLVLEFFWKDDANHDPLMIWNSEEHGFDLYDAKKPVNVGHLGVLPFRAFTDRGLEMDAKTCMELQAISRDVFLILEAAWAKLDVSLVDLKIECGFDAQGVLLVADVIDNDSWRIWPGGDKAKKLDKQTFRNFVDRPTIQQMTALKGNYAKIAELTRSFLET